MFKLVVLSVVLAVVVAAPKPGYLHAGYTAPLAYPAALSHSYRTEIHSKPYIAAYAAPAVISAPLVYPQAAIAAPIARAYGYGLVGGHGSGYGHGYGYGHGNGYGHGYGYGQGNGYGHGYGYGQGYGYGHGPAIW